MRPPHSPGLMRAAQETGTARPAGRRRPGTPTASPPVQARRAAAAMITALMTVYGSAQNPLPARAAGGVSGGEDEQGGYAACSLTRQRRRVEWLPAVRAGQAAARSGKCDGGQARQHREQPAPVRAGPAGCTRQFDATEHERRPAEQASSASVSRLAGKAAASAYRRSAGVLGVSSLADGKAAAGGRAVSASRSCAAGSGCPDTAVNPPHRAGAGSPPMG